MIAEYLRLEWDMVARDTHLQVPYAGKFSIAGITSRIMSDASGESALRVVDA